MESAPARCLLGASALLRARHPGASRLRDELLVHVDLEALDAALVAVAGSLMPPNGVSGVEIATLLTPTMPDCSASPIAVAVFGEDVNA